MLLFSYPRKAKCLFKLVIKLLKTYFAVIIHNYHMECGKNQRWYYVVFDEKYPCLSTE